MMNRKCVECGKPAMVFRNFGIALGYRCTDCDRRGNEEVRRLLHKLLGRPRDDGNAVGNPEKRLF